MKDLFTGQDQRASTLRGIIMLASAALLVFGGQVDEALQILGVLGVGGAAAINGSK